MKISGLLIGTAALTMCAGAAMGQCATQTLPNGSLQPGDAYGSAVAAKGSTMVVGVQGDDNAEGADAGIAYVNTKVNGWWNGVATLLPTDLAPGVKFGQSVAMDNYIAVGANQGPFTLSWGVGSVYMYAPSGATWVQQDKILSPDAATGDAFGWSVATMGDWLAVGSPGDDSNGKSDNGAVYIYHRVGSDWQFNSKLAFMNQNNAQLGFAVSMKNNMLAIGTQANNGAVAAAGAVYVYKLVGNVWSLQDFIAPPSPQDNGRFGYALSLDNSTLAVGAYLTDLPGPNSPDGAVYVYNLVNGHFVSPQTLNAGTVLTGMKVAVNGDVLVATDAVWYGNYTTHIFRRNGGVWSNSGAWNQWSGSQVDMDSDVAMTDTDIVLGMGGMDTEFGTNAGQVQVVPKTMLISPDDYSNPGVVGFGTTTGCTSLATDDGSSACGNSADSPDVWYSFMPNNGRRVMFDTIGSTYDTVLSLHTGPNGNRYTSQACADDSDGQLTSRIVYKGVAGQEIKIRVTGYGGATGWFALHVTEICPADFNADLTVDFFDYLDFVDAFSSEAAGADFNEDGTKDFFDYLDFVDAFSAGC